MGDIFTAKNVEDYLSIFTEMVVDTLEDPKWSDLGITKQWVSCVLFRNVHNAEVLHGLGTALAYKHLVKNPTRKSLHDAYVIGWCLHMYASCFSILDDIYDQSQTRNFKPCWYLVDNKGYEALHDAGLIEAFVFRLLHMHFGDRDFYLELVHTFQDASFKSALSKSLEAKMSKSDEHIDQLYTMKNYIRLNKYKTCYYPTYISAFPAMLLAGIKDKELLETARNIFQKIDFHFQTRDDYLDLYGDNEDYQSETGTDIEENRCTWNICTALEHASPEQKRLLIDNYGRKSLTSVQAVKEVYAQIGLPSLFEVYETEKYEEILMDIEAVPAELPQALFKDMMWASFPGKMNNGQRSDSTSTKNLKNLVKDVQNFLGVFPELIEAITCDPDTAADLGDISPSISRLFHYNVPHGKKSRGMTVARTFKALGNELDEEVVRKSYILGWCLEILHAAALVADDVMDQSPKRRGRACWYKAEGVGTTVYNDAIILEAALYRILKKHFGEEDYYLELVELFQDNTFKTAYGQALDVQTGKELDFETFTMARYTNIVKYKTSYYSFYLPFALALTMSRIRAKQSLEQSTEFLLEIGHFFQVQDDYLDCFGDSATTGKVGTDIADGKCSWLVVSALEMATEPQLRIIKENYGHGLQDPYKLQRIKELYIEMDLPEIYGTYEQETYVALQAKLDNMPIISVEYKNLLLEILSKTYNRQS